MPNLKINCVTEGFALSEAFRFDSILILVKLSRLSIAKFKANILFRKNCLENENLFEEYMPEWLEMKVLGYYCHLFYLYLTIKSLQNTEGFVLNQAFRK